MRWTKSSIWALSCFDSFRFVIMRFRALLRFAAVGGLRLQAKHRRVASFEHFAATQVHVDATRQTGIEAAYRAHNVNAFEFVGTVVLEDGRVLHGVFVGTGRTVHVARAAVPR